MPDDYPCLVTHPPVLGSTGHNYHRLALASRNLGCCVVLAGLGPPPTRVDGLPPLGSATRPLDQRSAHAGASSPGSGCLVLLSLQHSSNALNVATCPAVAGRASRVAGPQSTGLRMGSCYAQIAPRTRRIRVPARTLRPPLGCPETKGLSHSSLAGALECRFGGYSPGGPVGRLGTWELNLEASSSAAARIEDPSKGHSERHPPSDPRKRESSEVESVACGLAT